MPTERLALEGTLDAAKVVTLRQTLRAVWGIQSIDVDPVAGAVTFSYDDRAGSLADFRQAIESKGFSIKGGG